MHARHADHNGVRATGRATLALAAIAWLAAVAAAQPPSPSKSRLSMHVPVPPAVVVTEGLHRLLYELHIENRADVTITLSSLEIRTDTAQSAITLDGDRLVRALDTPADRKAPLAIAAGQRRVVYVDLGETSPPRVVRHVLRTTPPSPAAEDMLSVTVDPAPPVVLGAPLSGGPWAAVYHSDWERGHRRVFYTVDGVSRLPGRYTIDFVKVDDAGRTARGDVDLVVQSLGYGADALAVSDATVAAVRDDMPEVARVSARVKHRQEDAAGNYVSFDLGGGRFAVYEHLKPGSVRVRPGQRVRRGEVIGQLGFTGDSTGPHLHLHVGDAASPLAAEGRPFVFEGFEVLGRFADIATMGKARWEADGAGWRQQERPGPNVVVNFGPLR
jgi:murein DD-endopeptidase MepM/ murein hydrolase activator NlpD